MNDKQRRAMFAKGGSSGSKSAPRPASKPSNQSQPAFKVGQRVMHGEYPATIQKIHDGQLKGMADIQLPGGLATTSMAHFKAIPAEADVADAPTKKYRPIDAQQAIDHMGGMRALRLMVAADNFVQGDDYLKFRFKGSRKANHVMLRLDSDDLYTIEFHQFKPSSFDFVEKHRVEGLYFDSLTEEFERYTGLSLNVPRVRGLPGGQGDGR